MNNNQDFYEELIERQKQAEGERYQKLRLFKPFTKQLETISSKSREFALIAANRSGKSETAAFLTACHLTGIYPDIRPYSGGPRKIAPKPAIPWPGFKFDRPIRAWGIGTTAGNTMQILQTKLFGMPGSASEIGTGFVPKDHIISRTLSHGAGGAYDVVLVKHVSGGTSQLRFMSYAMPSETFSGDTVDWIWFDEEPPADIFREARTRLITTQGRSLITMTPLLGRTDLVIRYMEEQDPERGYINMGLMDNESLSPEDVEREITQFATHERPARAFGIPTMGTGRVFTHDENIFLEDPLRNVPDYFYKLWGLDFGIGHPFAAALIAWDKDNDIIHLLKCLKIKDALPIQHVARIRAIASAVPVAWPHDGWVRSKNDGGVLADQYRRPLEGMPGLKMLNEHSTWPEGSYSTEAAILELDRRITTGGFRCSTECTEWLEEYRMLHRDKTGRVNPVNNDIMDALFKTLMMKRFAKTGPLGAGGKGDSSSRINWNERAAGSDFDVFSGLPRSPW